jgi:hypothetical protein
MIRSQAPKLHHVSAFNLLAYRAIGTLQAEHGHRLTLDGLQFLGNVASRLKSGHEMEPDEVGRISVIRAVIAREVIGSWC